MVAANLTKSILSEGGDYVAKVTFIKEGATLTVKNKGRLVAFGDAFANALAEGTVYGFVVTAGVCINTDFPADTAVVGAFVGGAGEFIVVAGAAEKHL